VINVSNDTEISYIIHNQQLSILTQMCDCFKRQIYKKKMKYRLFFFLKGKNTRMKKARKEGKKKMRLVLQ
jgi:hypothetical protein